MKNILVHFSQEEYNLLISIKGNTTWKEFFLNVCGLNEQKLIQIQEEQEQEQLRQEEQNKQNNLRRLRIRLGLLEKRNQFTLNPNDLEEINKIKELLANAS